MSQSVCADPGNYFAARDQFRDLADRAGWRTDCFVIREEGAVANSRLTVDVAAWSGRSARTLIVSSGLHGVEGPLGSAVQRACLKQWGEERRKPPVDVLLIHALNPWGWVESRRTDASNRDLNRNFLVPPEKYCGAPAEYRQLNWFINPPRPPSRVDISLLAVPWILARYGVRRFTQSLAEGQYEFPQGLFFGGKGPAQQHELMREILIRFVSQDALVVHLDLHTGLGKRGSYMLLNDHPVDRSFRDGIRRWLSDATVHWADEPGDAGYQARGTLGNWCWQQRCCRRYAYFCVEFGTCPAWQVFLKLRAENRMHFWGESCSADRRERVKTRLREVFFPSSPQWRERAITDGVQLCERAIDGLASMALD